MLVLENLDINDRNETIKEYLEYQAKERKKIQDRYKFVIPIYILDEIIESYNKHREDNINALINMAKINGRLDEQQSKLLKNEFVFHNVNN